MPRRLLPLLTSNPKSKPANIVVHYNSSGYNRESEGLFMAASNNPLIPYQSTRIKWPEERRFLRLGQQPRYKIYWAWKRILARYESLIHQFPHAFPSRNIYYSSLIFLVIHPNTLRKSPSSMTQRLPSRELLASTILEMMLWPRKVPLLSETPQKLEPPLHQVNPGFG